MPLGTAEPATGAEERALKLFVVLSRARAAIHGQVMEGVRAQGLTEGEFAVLEALLHKGPLLLGDLQRKVLVSSGGVTYLVDRLEQRGLVVRIACPTDRRARYAGLTEAGHRLIAEMFPGHRREILGAMAALAPAEQEAAIELLRRLGLGAAASKGQEDSA